MKVCMTHLFSPLIRRIWPSPGDSLESRGDRARAWLHFTFADHAFLRGLWTNMFEIAPGVWRANQPSPRRLARWKAMGIRSVLNLRGATRQPAYLLEAEACARLGLTLVSLQMGARRLHPRETYLQLLDTFERIEHPFVMHCKSGADRAGIASAFYLMHIEGRSPQEAAAMLSLRFVHLKSTKTGILDAFLAAYAADHAETGIGLRDWIATRYDPEKIAGGFKPLYRFG